MLFLGNADAAAPKCVDKYWVSPDFVLFTGGEICEDRVAVCSFQGTKGEGWYSYKKSSRRTIIRIDCAGEF